MGACEFGASLPQPRQFVNRMSFAPFRRVERAAFIGILWRAAAVVIPEVEKMDRVGIVLFLLMLTALLGGCNGASGRFADEAAVRVGGQAVYTVDVAATPEDRQRGLSGRETMAQDEGMLFVFEEERSLHFWMKDMRFPLDIIWIDGRCELVGVSADVPTPPPNADSADIPRANSPAPAMYVLEVNAGEWARNGMSAGDRVEFLGSIEGQYGC